MVIVVGLGPGPAEWVTPAALETLRRPGARVFVRTAVHPAVHQVLAGTVFTSFDTLYETSPSITDLHARIAEALVAASASSEVVFAVPGDGALGEAAVSELAARGAELRIVPGVSTGPSALGAAGVASTDGAQVVEVLAVGGSGIGLGVELNPRWPAVVQGIYNRAIAGDLKLTLMRTYPGETQVKLVYHPGLPDQSVREMEIAELDRGTFPLDHLTHLVLPAVPTETPTGSPHGFRAIVSRLRAPEIGCPWDLEQTHASLIPFVIEEAYEVVEAIEDGNSAALMEELGDLLLQVYLHAELADQGGDFELDDVIREISAKLVRRHPHVFGEVQVGGAADVLRNWDELKKAEKAAHPPPESALSGVPKSFPALKQAAELGRKVVKAGFDWPNRAGAVAKVREELEELLGARSIAEQTEELGDLLWMLANLAMRDGIDPELALRDASRKFVRRFQVLEQVAEERGWSRLKERPSEDLLDAWSEAKRRVMSLPEARADR